VVKAALMNLAIYRGVEVVIEHLAQDRVRVEIRLSRVSLRSHPIARAKVAIDKHRLGIADISAD
jgi:Fe2+ transport system protein FeoA